MARDTERKGKVYRLLREDARSAVPDTVDLWPAIRQSLPLTPEEARGTSIVPLHRRLRYVAIIAFGVMLVLGLATGTTYQAQAAVSVWASRLGIGVTLVPWTDSPLPSPVAEGRKTSMPGATSGISAHPVAQAQAVRVRFLPLDEAQPQVSFPIRLPSRVPTGYTLAGAMVVNSGYINVQYDGGFDSAGRPKGAISLTEIRGTTTSSYTFPASRAEGVTVNGHPATYVHGAWQKDGTWNDAADLYTISWQADRMTFILQVTDTGFERADVMRIANSVP